MEVEAIVPDKSQVFSDMKVLFNHLEMENKSVLKKLVDKDNDLQKLRDEIQNLQKEKDNVLKSERNAKRLACSKLEQLEAVKRAKAKLEEELNDIKKSAQKKLKDKDNELQRLRDENQNLQKVIEEKDTLQKLERQLKELAYSKEAEARTAKEKLEEELNDIKKSSQEMQIAAEEKERKAMQFAAQVSIARALLYADVSTIISRQDDMTTNMANFSISFPLRPAIQTSPSALPSPGVDPNKRKLNMEPSTTTKSPKIGL